MCADDLADDGESQARSLHRFVLSIRRSEEAVENERDLVRRDAHPRVGDGALAGITSTSTRPDVGVNFTAFSITFVNACSSWSSSPSTNVVTAPPIRRLTFRESERGHSDSSTRCSIGPISKHKIFGATPTESNRSRTSMSPARS